MAKIIEIWLTRFSNKLREDLKECYDVLKREEKVTKEEFNSRLQILKNQIEGGLAKLEAKEQEYKELIQDLQRDEKRQAEEEYEQYAIEENDYLSVIIIATDALARIKRELLIEETSSQRQSGEVRNQSKGIKLPRITLPVYEGDPLEWEGF